MEIEGYENYLIHPDGKVQNKKTKRYLKYGYDGGGYLQVKLCKDGIPKNIKIHRLVATQYIPNPDNKPQVDHENGIKTDNRIENLRWATSSENNQNKGVQKNNTSGIKNISYVKSRDTYEYKKMINGESHQKYFKTLTEALCYKFIFILKSTI